MGLERPRTTREKYYVYSGKKRKIVVESVASVPSVTKVQASVSTQEEDAPIANTSAGDTDISNCNKENIKGRLQQQNSKIQPL